jgi:hypothetical protein
MKTTRRHMAAPKVKKQMGRLGRHIINAHELNVLIEHKSYRSQRLALSARPTPRLSKGNDFDSVGRVAAYERRHSTGDIRFHIDFDDLRPVNRAAIKLPRMSMPAHVIMVKVRALCRSPDG